MESVSKEKRELAKEIALCRREMVEMIWKDKEERRNGRTEPDTIGMDFFFIAGLLSQEGKRDFPYIQRDFLAHCRTKLPRFARNVKRLDFGPVCDSDYEIAQLKLVSLMYYGAKAGDAYCLGLVKYLLKLYHKKEYQILKKFSVITSSELMEFWEDEKDGRLWHKVGFCMGMCSIMGVKMSEEVDVYYLYLKQAKTDLELDAEEEETEICMDREMEQLLNGLLGWKEEAEEDEDYEPLFRPEKIQADREKKKEKEQRAEENPLSQQRKKEDTAALARSRKEIEALRQRLQERERANRNLQELYQTAREEKRSAEEQCGRYRNDREELLALREFVYQCQREDEPVPAKEIEQMKTAVYNRKVVIIGGHINWLNKLRMQFPNWTYIPTEDYRVIDGKMLEQKERVYFYTNHMSHITYHKFIAVVRERKIPFGYLRSVNLEKMVQQIYEEFENDK